MTGHRLASVSVKACIMLERNPQHLTLKQMDSLKRSIERDGFVVPILVREHGQKFEVVSGNHRFLAAKELGYSEIPAVIAKLSDRDAKRLAINLNLIHGDPLAEQLAPFLADMDDALLGEIHLDGKLLADTLAFDDLLATRLEGLEGLEGLDNPSPQTNILKCRCPKCGKDHIRELSSK